MKSAVCLSADLWIFFWWGKSTDLKPPNMSTNEQIRFFSADRRPGTKFLCRHSRWGSEPSLFPEDRKTHHPVTGTSQKLCEHKNVSYEAHLCPIIVKQLKF
jgi:hypothetical protein